MLAKDSALFVPRAGRERYHAVIVMAVFGTRISMHVEKGGVR